MSGGKHLWISEAEYNRLRAMAQQLGIVQAGIPNLLNQVQRQVQEDYERSLAAVRQRDHEWEQRVRTLDRAVQQAEQTMASRLEAQRAALTGALEAADRRHQAEITRLEEQAASQEARLQASIGWTQDMIREQDERLTQAIEDLREDLSDEIARIESELAQRQQHDEVTAEAWLTAARALNAQVASMPHHRFAPGRLTALQARLATAEANLQGGQAQAALAMAQQSYHDLGDLRLEIERRELEVLAARRLAAQQLRVVQQLVETNRERAVCPGNDEAGQPLPEIAYDVDFWSDGLLKDIEARVRRLIEQVEHENLSVDDLRRLASQTAPELAQQVAEAVQSGAVNVLAANLRETVIDVAAEALESQGYVLDADRSGHVLGDQREAAVARLVGPDDSSVVLIASADGLDVQSFDRDPAQAEAIRWHRARAIGRILREQGLAVGEPAVASQEPDREFEDVEQVLGGRVEKVLRQRRQQSATGMPHGRPAVR